MCPLCKETGADVVVLSAIDEKLTVKKRDAKLTLEVFLTKD